MAKRKWSDLSRTQQMAIAVVGVVEMAATTAMLIDLARRPASTVRGSKSLWLGLSWKVLVPQSVLIAVGCWFVLTRPDGSSGK